MLIRDALACKNNLGVAITGVPIRDFCVYIHVRLEST